ncbi:caspase domain-containing protein [Dichomitus squalens]|nr:caspase domain-containing protein [Dichomitus squalens]
MPTIPILRRFTAPWNHFQPQGKVLLKRFHTQLKGNDRQDAVVRKNPKKALIIGIGYEKGSGIDKLPNAHRDAKMWSELLKRKYGFDKRHIVMMLDDGQDPWLQPTKAKILREIEHLVQGVEAGDELADMVDSGHTGQVETDDTDEDDGLNEVLIPLDHEGYIEPGNMDKLIVDNDLRTMLVDKLPIGSKLTAVFDSCHSGTLLDLDHYLCNEVYQPFLCRTPSQQKSRWMAVKRKDACDVSADWEVREGQAVPRPVVRGSTGSREGTRIHQRLRESSEKISCVDTSLTRLPNGDKGERRFQLYTSEHTSTHTAQRANSPVTPSAHHVGTTEQTARTDTRQSEQATRTTKRASVQIRQTSGQTETTEWTKRTASRQNSLTSVMSYLGLRRTTSPEPMPDRLCVSGKCAITSLPITDVVGVAHRIATH